MPKRKKSLNRPAKRLDTVLGRRGRGRPPKMLATEVFGRARNYEWILELLWEPLREPLLHAQTEEEIIKAFTENAGSYAREFVPALAPLILQVLRDRRFPKRDPKPRKGRLKPRKLKPNPRIVFLADSLAGRGSISPRRSRDVCARERAKERTKSKHRILRWEYYIECSCGYRGPARSNACRKCGAQIPPSLGPLLSPGLY
jgi:site-specific DNA-cytosine methylase